MRRNVAPSLRSLTPADVEGVDALLEANRGVFTDVEVRTAKEMVREGLANPAVDDAYQFLVAEEAGRLVGYACFGSIPLTEGAFDLYWIVVAPEAQGLGVGRALCLRVEETIAAQGGRLVVVEASSLAGHDRACRFYERTMRYDTVARIRDFYAPGNDKIVYVRYLANGEER
jgi:ribosomal protein S18 acetylase RimI-like enzyme